MKIGPACQIPHVYVTNQGHADDIAVSQLEFRLQILKF
jgi:hypothetical protein